MAESEGLKIGRSLFFCFLKVLGEFAWDGKRKQNLRSGVGSQCSSLSRIILLTLRTIPSALLSPFTTCRGLKTHPMTVAQAAMMLFPRVDEWVVGLVLEALGLGVGFQSEISAPGRTDGAGQATMVVRSLLVSAVWCRAGGGPDSHPAGTTTWRLCRDVPTDGRDGMGPTGTRDVAVAEAGAEECGVAARQCCVLPLFLFSL